MAFGQGRLRAGRGEGRGAGIGAFWFMTWSSVVARRAALTPGLCGGECQTLRFS